MTLMYGAELWGGAESRTQPVQAVVNRCLRVLVGCRMSSSLPASFALYRELNCPPVHVMALQRRCRAFLKYPTLKTWISDLIHNCRGLKTTGSWVAATKTLMTKKNANPQQVMPESGPAPTEPVLESHRAAIARAGKYEWERLESAKTVAATARQYLAGDFKATSLASADAMWPVQRGMDLTHLTKARVGAYVTGSRMRHWSPDHSGACAFCDSGEREDLPHLLLHCDKWDRLREALLEPWIDKAQELLKDNESDVDTLDADTVTLLLGGRVAGGRLSNWIGSGNKKDDTESASGSDSVTTTSSAADSTSTDESEQDRLAGAKGVGCFCVGRYLCRVSALRWKHKRR